MNRWISFLFLPCMSYKSARARRAIFLHHHLFLQLAWSWSRDGVDEFFFQHSVFSKILFCTFYHFECFQKSFSFSKQHFFAAQVKTKLKFCLFEEKSSAAVPLCRKHCDYKQCWRLDLKVFTLFAKERIFHRCSFNLLSCLQSVWTGPGRKPSKWLI